MGNGLEKVERWILLTVLDSIHIPFAAANPMSHALVSPPALGAQIGNRSAKGL